MLVCCPFLFSPRSTSESEQASSLYIEQKKVQFYYNKQFGALSSSHYQLYGRHRANPFVFFLSFQINFSESQVQIPRPQQTSKEKIALSTRAFRAVVFKLFSLWDTKQLQLRLAVLSFISLWEIILKRASQWVLTLNTGAAEWSWVCSKNKLCF